MYRVAVKIESLERRKKSTGLLHVVAGFFMVPNAVVFFQLAGNREFYYLIPVVMASVVSIVYGLFRKKMDADAKYNQWLRLLQFFVFTILGTGLAANGNDWITISVFGWAIVTLMLMFTERKVFHEPFIQVKKEGIQIPGYFGPDTLPWNSIESFIARPDFITIFKANKTYIQVEVGQKIEATELSAINKFAEGYTSQKQEVVYS